MTENRLLSACLENRLTAPWREAVKAFEGVIASTVVKVLRRIGTLNLAQADDLIQEVYLRLCKDNYRILRDSRMPDPGSLYGLVQAVATTTVLDHLRSASAQKRGGGARLVAMDGTRAPEYADLSAQRGMDRQVLISQIDQYLHQVGGSDNPGRDRQIFWLYYRHGFTAKDIASIPSIGLTAKGVESVIHRITSEVRQLVSTPATPPKGERS